MEGRLYMLQLLTKSTDNKAVATNACDPEYWTCDPEDSGCSPSDCNPDTEYEVDFPDDE